MVINTAEIALPGDEWKKRAYFHHTGYAGGASWTLAWQLHEKDPTMVRPVCRIKIEEKLTSFTLTTSADHEESRLPCNEGQSATTIHDAEASSVQGRGGAQRNTRKCDQPNTTTTPSTGTVGQNR